jgi:hypothetical protein
MRGAEVVLNGIKTVERRMTMSSMVLTTALKGPTLSPTNPIEKRPRQEQAPRIDNKVYPSSTENPAPVAIVGKRPLIP